ncbi:unnamed protein product [Durusdinium trenchii]|uniref:Uncharacterized protein n=1 Tax=Durusdinium trenchii TaxID=1381693 RepID=A0ABP0SIN1_9DINO
MRMLKEALAARLEGSGGLFAQQEETGQLEKDINLREHQLDNPEMVDMLLQRWFAQRSFCVKNVGDRRQLAETFWKVQRNSKRAQGRRYVPKKSIRGKLTSTASPLRSSSSLFVDKMETGAVEADLTTERGVLLEIKRAMIKLKRKCRVLEGQWVEVPRMTLPRLQKRCRVLQLKVDETFRQTEIIRKKLLEADERWTRMREGSEPTLLDLELEAWDIRVELAKSVIRWVRKDRKEAQARPEPHDLPGMDGQTSR